MQKNFVTLFNSNYLSRGITMYKSLLASTKSFHLYIVAFDDATYQYLISENLPHITPISLKEFEDPELLRIKPTRSASEYCWTCTASTVYYCLNKFKLSHCVYIDADLFFYNDPQVLFDEWGANSILITKHRFSKIYEDNIINGIYCVQFVGFKNDEEGMKALKWWREACIEWCYHRLEDGKFGDQKYLNDWPQRFKNVCDLQYLGGGVAPWNVQQYNFTEQNNKWTGTEIASGKKFELIFYHFHAVKFFTDDTLLTGIHDLSKNDVKTIYFNYVKELVKTGNELKRKLPGVNIHAASAPSAFKPMTGFARFKNSLKNISGLGGSIPKEQENLFYLKDINSE